MSKERAYQAVENVLQTHQHVIEVEALRFKIVSVAQRVQCQPKELPANALLLKHAMQTNCPSQPMQKREIVYLI
jgi:hypothetical protein